MASSVGCTCGDVKTKPANRTAAVPMNVSTIRRGGRLGVARQDEYRADGHLEGVVA